MKTGVYDSYGLYSNSEYDSLIDSLTGERQRKTPEIYQKLEDLLVAQDCGVAPLYYSDKHYYYQNWVKDFHTSLLRVQARSFTEHLYRNKKQQNRRNGEEGAYETIGSSFAIIIRFRSEKTGQGEDFYAKIFTAPFCRNADHTVSDCNGHVFPSGSGSRRSADGACEQALADRKGKPL